MRTISALFVLLLLLGSAGCTKEVSNDYDKLLRREIRPGLTLVEAEQVLDRYQFTHSFDPKTNTIYALKRSTTSDLIRQDWSAQIKLNVSGTVISIKVEKVYTGL